MKGKQTCSTVLFTSTTFTMHIPRVVPESSSRVLDIYMRFWCFWRLEPISIWVFDTWFLSHMWDIVCFPIKVKEIILCYRRFGQNPTEEIITKRMALINPTASKLTFPEFCEMMGNTINYYDLEFSLGKGLSHDHYLVWFK